MDFTPALILQHGKFHGLFCTEWNEWIGRAYHKMELFYLNLFSFYVVGNI